MPIAIAARLIELPAAAAPDVHLLPAGPFRAVDGRPADAPHWILPETAAAALSARLAARQTARVIDYEHQTLHAERNGQPAPAAGWFRRVEWRADGLYAAAVEWTARARAALEAGEYRYISPVFTYEPGSGVIVDVLHAGLTNTPALDGLAAVAARSFFPLPPEDSRMTIPTAVCSALDLADGAEEAAVVAAIAALKTTAPDPAQYAPVAALRALQDELAALRAAGVAAERDGLIEAALKDGRLSPPLEGWARDLGAKAPDALREYLAAATPLAALTGMQTAGRTPPAPPADADPRAAFTADPALQAEFGTAERYVAYAKARAAGRVRILGSKA